MLLINLRKQWYDVRLKGDMLFLEQHGVVNQTAAEAMETFDTNIERLSNQLQMQVYSIEAITVSIGCATSAAGLSEVDSVLRAADEAMYQAKASGRNQVACSGSG